MVILIMLCALVGTVAMLALCGCARWSFIYLIHCRLLKKEVKKDCFIQSTKHDITAIIIAVITLAAVAVLLIYGLPFVIKHISELPIPESPLI